LAVSGVLFQSVMRNPLADPGVLGISAGARLASAAVLAVAPSWLLSVPVFAFAGGAVACALVYLLSWKRGLEPLRVVLVGVAVNAAFTGLADAMNFAGGGGVAVIQLGMKTWRDVFGMVWYVAAGLTAAVLLAPRCNMLALTDETLAGLGVNVNALRIAASCAAVLLAAVASAYAGILSFVGLIVPHIGKALVGSDHKKLVPFSILAGAFTVLFADTVGRVIAAPAELPATVVTAVAGGPFFILLLRRSGKRKRNFKKGLKPLFVAAGLVAFALGTAGILLPVLPTTPFYLLSAFCLARGSARFHRWLVSTRLYQTRVERFVRTNSMTARAKLMICIPATAVMLAAFWFTPVWYGRAAIAAALCFKWYYFLFKIKTRRGEDVG
jgi:iron complex transport system permease protein